MTDQAIPPRVRAFVAVVCLVAAPVLTLAVLTVVRNPPTEFIAFLAFTILTIVTAPVFVLLPSVSALVTIGDAFVICISMMFGWAPGVLAHTLNISCLTLLLRKRRGTAIHRVVFNIALAVISSTLFGVVYQIVRSHGSSTIGTKVVPTFAVAATFFLSNSFFVATAIALTLNRGIFRVWKENYPALFLDYLVSASAAAFIQLSGEMIPQYREIVPLFAAPFVGAIWGINKINKAKADEAERHLREQEGLYTRTVESLALAVDAKDQTTYGHIRRVRAYSLVLAAKCGIVEENDLKAIETGSLLHDIGKLAIEDYILNKPGRLTKQEFEKMKLHSAAGHEILEQIQFPFPVSRLVRSHHERWDGNGYPDGLRGEAIPLGARILTLADAYDTIRSSRPYKRPFSTEEAIALLKAQSGTLFDPTLVEIFIRNIDELEAAAAQATRQMAELSFRKYFASVNESLTGADGSIVFPPYHPTASTTVELVRLAEFAGTIGRHLNLREVLGVVNGRIQSLVPAATWAIYLDNGDGTVRAMEASGKLAEALTRMRVELGKGISGWVTAHRKAVVNTDPGLEFGLCGENSGPLTDTVAVPLINDGQSLGAIVLFGEPPRSFSQAELLLLETVAGIVSPLVAAKLAESDTQPPIDTVAYNAGYLAVVAAQMASAAGSNDSVFSLLSVEIPNLGQIAQLCGRHASENLVSRVAGAIRSELRDTDVMVRYGPNSLVVLLPGLRLDQARTYAQRLRRQISAMGTQDLLGSSLVVQCEVGVATYPADGTDVVALLRAVNRSPQTVGSVSPRQAADSDKNVVEFPLRY